MERIEVITSVQRRRRYTGQEKAQFVAMTMQPGSSVEKKYNKMIGKIRVVIEHINSQLKTFRILSERYRNRRKRFGLRINLIAALVNRINFQ